MKKLPLVCCAVAAAMLPMGANALAPEVQLGQAQYTIGITGFVPVICRASVDATSAPVTGATVSLGSLREFCNNAAGYQVVANYSPNLAGARLLVDGVAVPLDATGSQVVSRSAQASVATHQLDLELPAGAAAGSLSFRIEPL